MVDLNEVYVFIKVVEAGSFVGAGRQINMPATTVSRKVQKLEDTLGVRLMYRSTRKLRLTDIGRQYFESCQKGLAGIEEANALASLSGTEPSGLLRVTSPADFAVQYGQPWIDSYLTRYPKVRVEFEITDRYVDMISERIDVAFRSGTLGDSSLIARRIGPKQSVFCASPRYLARNGIPRHPEDLKRHDCVIMGNRLQKNYWRFVGEGEDITVPVTGRYAVDNMNLVIRAALNDLGVAQVPKPLVGEVLRRGELISLLPDYPAPPQDIYLIYPSHKHLARNVRVFIDHVVEATTPRAPWEEV